MGMARAPAALGPQLRRSLPDGSVGPGQRALHLLTDADAVEAADRVVQTIRSWGDGEIDVGELDAAKDALRERVAREPFSVLLGAVTRELVDGRPAALGEHLDDLWRVERADVAELAALLHDRMLITLPSGQPSKVLPRLRVVAPAPIVGPRHPRHPDPPHVKAVDVIVGPDGVTVDGTPPRTVRYDACSAAMLSVRGRIELMGPSGDWILVDPRDIENGREAVAAITDALEPSAFVQRPTAPGVGAAPPTCDALIKPPRA